MAERKATGRRPTTKQAVERLRRNPVATKREAEPADDTQGELPPEVIDVEREAYTPAKVFPAHVQPQEIVEYLAEAFVGRWLYEPTGERSGVWLAWSDNNHQWERNPQDYTLSYRVTCHQDGMTVQTADGILKQLAEKPKMRINPNVGRELDGDPLVRGVPSGRVLDFNRQNKGGLTPILRTAEKTDYATRRLAVSPIRNENEREFIDGYLDGLFREYPNKEREIGKAWIFSWLKRALFGKADEHDLALVIHGKGRTGKSGFGEAVAAMMGSATLSDGYGVTMNASHISARNKADGLTRFKALRDACFVHIDELPLDNKSDVVIVNNMIAGGKIVVGQGERNRVEFDSPVSVLITTENLPQADGSTGFYERLAIFDADYEIPPEERKPEIAERLKGNVKTQQALLGMILDADENNNELPQRVRDNMARHRESNLAEKERRLKRLPELLGEHFKRTMDDKDFVPFRAIKDAVGQEYDNNQQLGRDLTEIGHEGTTKLIDRKSVKVRLGLKSKNPKRDKRKPPKRISAKVSNKAAAAKAKKLDPVGDWVKEHLVKDEDAELLNEGLPGEVEKWIAKEKRYAGADAYWTPRRVALRLTALLGKPVNRKFRHSHGVRKGWRRLTKPERGKRTGGKAAKKKI